MKSGFTIIEVLLVVGIMLVLLSIASLNLSNITPKAAIDGAVNILIADLKQQQIKSMAGEMTSAGNADNFGVHFLGSNYVLFHGNSYNPAATDNFSVTLDDIQFSTTFGQSSIIFNRINGEISNFVPSHNTITISQSNTNESRVITINKYGVIESIL